MAANPATLLIDPREYWGGMDARSRLLAACVAVSIVLHAILISVHFRFPDALRMKSSAPPLDVVLVNAKTRDKPTRADVLAQASLDGGGNVDERRRSKTPLPVTKPREPGRDLADAQRRVKELEAQQQRLLALAKKSPASVAPESQHQAPTEQPSPQASGRELADLSLAAMRLQAELDKRHEAYQRRPRKTHIGSRATEYRFAQYEDEWRIKIERTGTLHYPAEARGKLYGTLRLTVTVRPDGTVESIELDKSSGLKVLDRAAFDIVRMSAPFGMFPASIRKDTDLLVITRTWFFGQGDKIWTE